ncbi:DUF7507 domain-containing protein, partial [Microbulbifer sp.]|uniref:DUF7507 domain-containing protein n=1 Tax=Microbulbifer sp. TaxID=1908541 RepID=UPI003F32A10D
MLLSALSGLRRAFPAPEFKRSFARHFRWLVAAAAFALCAPLQAQMQRGFANQGFELPDLQSAGCRVYIDHALVPGWITNHPDYGQENVGGCTVPSGFVAGQAAPIIELWDTPRSGVNARGGSQLAELNAEQESRLSQSVCLINGEQVDWAFSHRGRESSTAQDVMELLVGSDPVVRAGTTNNGSGGVITEYLGSATSTAGPDGWRDYSGSFTYTGASGLVDIGFEAISTAQGNIAYGNFLDEVRVTLAPNIELSSDSFTSPEGDNTSGLPELVVTGTVVADIDVTLSVVGGTADLVDDFTTPGGGSSFTVTVPAGNYDGTSSLSLGVASLDDAIVEGDETVEFEVAASPGDYNVASTTSCGAAANTTATWTITDTTPELSLNKIAGAPSGNSAGDTIDYTFTVTNTGSVTVDGIAITDAQLDAAATCDTTTLAPGAIATCNGIHTITQAEVDAGTVDNTATASGTDPGSNPVSANDSTSTALTASPALDLNKVAGAPSGNSAGDTIAYTFTVTNTGNVTIDGIAIADPQ